MAEPAFDVVASARIAWRWHALIRGQHAVGVVMATTMGEAVGYGRAAAARGWTHDPMAALVLVEPLPGGPGATLRVIDELGPREFPFY